MNNHSFLTLSGTLRFNTAQPAARLLILLTVSILLFGALPAAYGSEIEERRLAGVITAGEPEYGEEFPRPLRNQRAELPARLKKEQMEQIERKQNEILPGLPGFEKAATQNFIRCYAANNGNREWIIASLKNGEPYLAFIRDEIRARGMPEEFLYLPLIESAYLCVAKSRSGAHGLWQFMKNSIQPYMRIDEWLDERRDFWKSTNAALSKLQNHYREFGDWELALAAYNSGGGAVAKAIRSAGINDYWALSETGRLKRESVCYVPQLLAIYHIVSNPRKFNLDICRPSREYVWTRVKPGRQIDISLLAEHAGMSASVLRRANSELSCNITPPDPAYELKIPKEYEDAVSRALGDRDVKLLKSYIYKIQGGDTLSALSAHYGVCVRDILAQNPHLRPECLRPGETVSIPAYKEVAPYKGAAAKKAQTAKATAGGKGKSTEGRGRKYTVKKGDTLWSISRRFNVKIAALTAANNLNENGILKTGRVLKIP